MAKYDANLKVQPAGAIKAINALLGWVPFILGLVLLVVSISMKIETEVKAMNEGKKEKGLI